MHDYIPGYYVCLSTLYVRTCRYSMTSATVWVLTYVPPSVTVVMERDFETQTLHHSYSMTLKIKVHINDSPLNTVFLNVQLSPGSDLLFIQGLTQFW